MIYDFTGGLVAFSIRDSDGAKVGFVRHGAYPKLHVATLTGDEEISRSNLQVVDTLAKVALHVDGERPQNERVRYAFIDGELAIESFVPVMGEAFNPKNGKQEFRQLGAVVSVQPLGQSFIDYLASLTDLKINIFTSHGLSVGDLSDYRTLDWTALKADSSTKINEINVGGKGYYQVLLPLYAGAQQIGVIAALNSRETVEKYTWEMIYTLSLIALAGLLLSFPLVLYLANSIAHPITTLSRIFRRVAIDKNMSLHSEDVKQLEKQMHQPDELGVLTQSFMAMNDEVNEQIQEISEINASLEQTVAERTAELTAREQESRTLIENSPDTISRYDTGCRRLYVNPAFSALAEGGDAALLGKTPKEMPGGPNAELYETKLREAIASGTNLFFELSWIGKSGREIFSHIRLTPEFDTSGKVVSVLAIGRDIADLKQAEFLLNNSLAFNKSILDSSPSGIAVFKEEGLCIMANESYARTIGATVEIVLKQNFRESESWQHNGLLDLANQALLTGKTFRQDFEGITSFGKRVVLDCIFSTVTLAGRVHLLLITNDDSERAAAVSALNESMQLLAAKELAKTRFLAAAGHDLRQPLAAANLFIDALKFTGPSPEQDKIIQRLNVAMETFNGLLDALLNISKLDAGIIHPEFTPINVSELMIWLEESFAPLAAEKKIGFKLYFSMKESLVVHGDIGLIKSALMNLISNAIKFTARGAILISARRRGMNALFQVWDTGIGIEEANIEHIFDEFYQVNNPQRDRTSGLGLGLSIAKRALALLDSRVTCRSRLEHGAVFGFLLPLNLSRVDLEHQEIVSPAEMNESEAEFVCGKQFVIVEDDKLVAQAMVTLFEGMGGVVKQFHSAEDALHSKGIEDADYYIADFMLGGELSGVQFLQKLRLQRDKPTHAVVMTGDTSASTLHQAKQYDWPMIHKPATASKIILALRAQKN